jgi:hypothetical protein
MYCAHLRIEGRRVSFVVGTMRLVESVWSNDDLNVIKRGLAVEVRRHLKPEESVYVEDSRTKLLFLGDDDRNVKDGGEVIVPPAAFFWSSVLTGQEATRDVNYSGLCHLSGTLPGEVIGLFSVFVKPNVEEFAVEQVKVVYNLDVFSHGSIVSGVYMRMVRAHGG